MSSPSDSVIKSSTPDTDQLQLAQKLQLQLAPDFTSKLSSYNGASPLVTFQLDTSKINQTFNTVFELIGSLQGVVSDVCATVNRHDSAVDTLRSDLDELKNRFDNDDRFDKLESKLNDTRSRLDQVEKRVNNIGGKVDAVDQRLLAQEAKKVDLGPLERELSSMKTEVRAIATHTNSIAEETTAHGVQIKNCEEQFETVRANAKAVKALYNVFEMDQNAVMNLADDPTNGEELKEGRIHGAPAISKLTKYCLDLPSFSNLRFDMKNTLDASVNEVKRRHADDMANVNGRLADKADIHDLQSLQNEVSETARTVKTLNTRCDKLAKDMNAKMDTTTANGKFEHLQNTKADKSELVDLLHRGDLGGLEDDVGRLQQALDSMSSKMNLELGDLRNNSAMSNRTVVSQPTSSRRSSVATDPTLLSRLDSLERETADLKENKADKKSLGEVYLYVDNALQGVQNAMDGMKLQRTSRPSTPVTHPIGPAVPAPTEGSRYGALQPLSRPPSAGRDGVRSGSIPEVARPPSPNLQYTSSPMKYVPNNAKWRATATLFDSDGGRTNASVTASGMINNVTHLENMAAVAAGQERIPSDHTTHDIPAN